MSSFPFTLIVQKDPEPISIPPPMNFTSLLKEITEKFTLKEEDCKIFYKKLADPNDPEDFQPIPLTNDSDYVELINYGSNLKEVEILINPKFDPNRKKQKKKKSINARNEEEIEGVEDEKVDFHAAFDPSSNNPSGKTKNYKDQKRIFYIKQNKEMQRAENKANEENNEGDDEQKKSNKREIKNKNK